MGDSDSILKWSETTVAKVKWLAEKTGARASRLACSLHVASEFSDSGLDTGSTGFEA